MCSGGVIWKEGSQIGVEVWKGYKACTIAAQGPELLFPKASLVLTRPACAWSDRSVWPYQADLYLELGISGSGCTLISPA